MRNRLNTQYGVIVNINRDKGFGFVKPDNGVSNLFMHFSNCITDESLLEEGTKVSYLVKKGRKGDECSHVQKVNHQN